MLGPLQRATHTIPIVFVQVADAVGGGFVKSLAKPGGNATGFTNFEFDISTKWLELLKQIAPRMTRTAVLRDPNNPSGTGAVRRHPSGGSVARRGGESNWFERRPRN